MKNIMLTCLLGLSSVFTFAQNIVLNGVVNDAKGNPIAYAFVKDADHNYATYTDSFGAFNLKVTAADRLLVTAINFKGITVKISDPQKINVVMIDEGTKTTVSIDPDSFKEHLSNEGMTKNTATGYIAHENTLHGSNYLFDHWVHGYAITTDDSIKQNSNYLYNYQKADGSLLFTNDGKTMQQIDKRLINKFVLFDDQGNYTFENAPAIDATHFVQVLGSGSSYKIYKQLNTKFFPNDYVSNGMTSSGNNYDEIKDEPVYYAVKLPGGAPQKFTLKNKSLKTTFAADAAKVNKYLSSHDGDIDDTYLIGLADYLNN